jgi:protein TonB
MTPGAESSEQLLQSRLQDLPRIDIEPPVVPAPALPVEEKNSETSVKPPVRIGGKVEPARLLKQIPPAYPPLARTARVQGAVIIDATIAESGAVEDLIVVEGHPMLIAAALEAVQQWRYEPAKLNGIPTRSSVRVTVNFRLQFPR